jgi:hypothetical protein
MWVSRGATRAKVGNARRKQGVFPLRCGGAVLAPRAGSPHAPTSRFGRPRCSSHSPVARGFRRDDVPPDGPGKQTGVPQTDLVCGNTSGERQSQPPSRLDKGTPNRRRNGRHTCRAAAKFAPRSSGPTAILSGVRSGRRAPS